MIDLIDKNIGTISYIFGIITSLMAFYATYLEKKDKKGKLKKRISKVTLWTAIFGILTLLSQWRKDIVSSIDQANEIANARKNEKNLIRKTDTISTLQKYLQDSVSQIIKQQSISISKLNTTIKTQNKLVEGQQETIKHYFGEGFPMIYFSQRNKNFYDAILLNSKTEYPLFEVQISAFNSTKLNLKGFRIENGMAFYHKDSLDKYTKDILPISISPHTSSVIGYTIERKNLPAFITFKMTARNGPVYQYTFLWESGGLVYQARKIFKPIKTDFKLLFSDSPKEIREKMWEENFIYKKHYKPEYY